MPSNIAAAKAMIVYAKKHNLTIPRLSTVSPVWGSGKKQLAWRVSGHAFGAKKAATQKTPALCNLLFPKTLGQRIVEVALSQVGVHETPYASNDGPKVHEYQEVTGAYKQPWCASFVAWCARQAGYKGNLPSVPAWVPSWASFHPCSKRNLKTGGYVCLWHSGHIEVFVRWVIPYVLADCVGGNTSPVGANANGGMVAKTRRYATEMNAVGNVA